MDRWVKGKPVEKYLSSRIFTVTKYRKGKNHLILTTAPKTKETRSYGKIELQGRTLFEGNKINAKKFLKNLIAKDEAYMVIGLINNPVKIGAKRAVRHVRFVNFMFLDRKDRTKAIKKLEKLGIKRSYMNTLDETIVRDYRYILTINYEKLIK